jgi:hypothetical protein
MARAKLPRAGRTTARLKLLVMRAKADIAARHGVSMEHRLRRFDVETHSGARVRSERGK